MNKKVNENEVRLFWQIVGELRQAIRDEREQYLIDYHIDELEGVCANTDQPELKLRAEELLAIMRPQRVNTTG